MRNLLPSIFNMNKKGIIVGIAALLLSSCGGPLASISESAVSMYIGAIDATIRMNPAMAALADTSKEFCPEILRSGVLMCNTTRGHSESYWSKSQCVSFEYEGDEDDVAGSYCFHPKGCAQVTIQGEDYKIIYELFFTSPNSGTVIETYICDSDKEVSKGRFNLR